MPLKNADIETLQQHVDALNIMVNLVLSEMADSAPQSLQAILHNLRHSLDTSPQFHPKLREQLQLRYMTFAELLAGASDNAH